MKKIATLVLMVVCLQTTRAEGDGLKMSDFMKDNANSLTNTGQALGNLSESLYQKELAKKNAISNLFIATPPFSDEEKAFLFSNGYYVNNTDMYLIAGEKNDRVSFLGKLGFDDYVAKYRKVEKTTAYWRIASIVTLLSSAALVLYDGLSPTNTSISTPSIISLGAFTVSLTGYLINDASKPPQIPFEVIANKANARNRELLKSLNTAPF